ncbi:MAG: 6-oxopurine nucleoside phosphorylase [Acidimicrobiia bacterium]
MEAGPTRDGRLAVIGGHSILDSEYTTRGRRVDVGLDGGDRVAVLDCGTHVVVQRHGLGTYTPAHRVRHVDTLRAVAVLGCNRVLALSSVGGLRHDVGVGTFLAPDDFIALHTSVARYDDARGHRVPGFDRGWRERIVGEWGRVVSAAPLRDGGVYWQTIGPRFETPAEIRYIAQFADVVGMTVGSECVVAGELGLAYAAVCVVDNLANGVDDRILTLEEFEHGKAANRAAVIASLDALVPELA